MDTLVIFLFIAVTLALVYVMLVRPLVVNAPLLSPLFAREASFLDKVRVRLAGWKTKIAARFVTLSGILVTLYDYAIPYATGQDWTPVTAKLPSWALPVGLVAAGALFGYLRHITENPPVVVVQKDDSGTPLVVDLIKPAA